MLYNFVTSVFANLPPLDLTTEAKGVWIYQNHFSKLAKAKTPNTTSEEAEEAFFQQISEACRTLVRWEESRKSRPVGDKLLTEWDGLHIKLQQTEWKRKGEKTKILLPYYVLGADGWLRIDPKLNGNDKWGARLYLMLKAESAASLVSAISFCVEKPSISFQLKIALSLWFYSLRRDSCVLYFRKEDKDFIIKTFSPIFRKLRKENGLMRESIPLAEKIAPGVFYAEDPEKEMSFGMHRSYLVAKGLDRCGKKIELARFFQVVQDVFSEEGLSPEHPWKQNK
ncbi:MAG: hypothetical protein A3H42_00945 [Deltaproteobacteria bacterium RIFCSPLOWO2_02_FULL_46_8]|nr:MAG: hypothetical protein A3H42_00945 [Deltaproteobacteria bacterium RIFCSPLOWO2_02_FULL_46_8]